MIEEYLTVSDVMQLRQCSRSKAMKLIRNRGGFKVWGMWVIHKKQLEAAGD